MKIEINDDIARRLQEIAQAHGTDSDGYANKLLDGLLPTSSIKARPEIHSVTHWLSQVRKMIRDYPLDRFYFRGEPSHYPKLIPKLQRRSESLEKVYDCQGRGLLELQFNVLERMSRYTAQYHYDSTVVGRLDNIWEWLCIAQHHGYPTVMLDWSLNPLVALFFALDDPFDKLQDHNGKIWVMRLKKKDNRQRSTVHVSENRLSGDKIIDPQDKPLVVVPRILTRRIDAQAGRFIFWPKEFGLNEADPSKIELPWEKIDSYTVPHSQKEEIRNQLGTFRIHEGTMYADLDGYARYLSRGGI